MGIQRLQQSGAPDPSKYIPFVSYNGLTTTIAANATLTLFNITGKGYVDAFAVSMIYGNGTNLISTVKLTVDGVDLINLGSITDYVSVSNIALSDGNLNMPSFTGSGNNGVLSTNGAAIKFWDGKTILSSGDNRRILMGNKLYFNNSCTLTVKNNTSYQCTFGSMWMGATL